MKKVLLNIVVYSTLVFCVLFLINVVTQFIANNKDVQPSDTIYLWGDSEMYQGIDMHDLAKITGRTITSSATHGNGVYDFLVFCNRVPEHSYCVISFSTTCLTRVKEHDYNRLGTDIPSLLILAKNGYTFEDIFTIVHNNYFSAKPIFRTIGRDELYPHQDTICHTDKLAVYEELFHSKHDYENNKWQVFLAGVEKLHDKQCQLLFVVFPWHSLAYEKYLNSISQTNMNNNLLFLSSKYCDGEIENIEFNDKDTLCMYDLVHMNEVGAKRTTQVLGKYINSTIPLNDNHIVVINGMVCN